ncbi:MAG: hypothetical protein AAGA34_13650 [Pseudomonadota bacterium]
MRLLIGLEESQTLDQTVTRFHRLLIGALRAAKLRAPGEEWVSNQLKDERVLETQVTQSKA